MASRGWENVTMPSKGARIGSGRLKGRSKYNAAKTTVDGITFDSRAEARRYQELRCMERIGEITGLTTQPSYCLEAQQSVGPARSCVIGTYRGDFAYFDALGREVVEDVKGFKTPLYRWKKKHVEAQYNIVIREVK